MTIRHIESSPHGLRLVFRISLALLVMVLAERAANLSHGEPDNSGDADSVSSFSATASDEDQDQPNYSSPSADGEETPSTQRLREGTILTDVIGRFKVSGDRATFTITETGQSFGGLENLNLARVMNAIRDDPDADWNISGLVTEHRGLNFLLIQKAIRKTSSNEIGRKSPLPDSVSTPLDDSEEPQSGAPTAF
jgi:hypothetical protein